MGNDAGCETNCLALTRVAMPQRSSICPQKILRPRRPGIAADGSLWIPEFNTGHVTHFNPTNNSFTRYELGNSNYGPYDVAVDPSSGDVWSASSLGSAMIRIDPSSGQRDRFPFPTEPAYPRHIAIDPASGDIWTTYSSMPRCGATDHTYCDPRS